MRHHAPLFHDDRGQDLIEYTLLIALLVLASAALLLSTGRDLGIVWAGGDQVLSSARNVASGNPDSGGGSGGNPGFGSGGNPGSPGNPGNNPNPGRGR